MKTISLIFLAACIIAAVSAYPAEEKAPDALNPVEDVLPVEQLTEDEQGGERVKRQYGYGGRGYGGYGGYGGGYRGGYGGGYGGYRGGYGGYGGGYGGRGYRGYGGYGFYG